MRNPFSGVLDSFMGRGSAAVTVPPLDGALKPNNLLEELPTGIVGNAPDDSAIWNGEPVYSDENRVMSFSGATVVTMSSAITALAATGDRLAIASLNNGLEIFDAELENITPKWTEPVRNVTALSFTDAGALWFCVGSSRLAPDEWRRDLMEMNRAGSVGLAELATGMVSIIISKLGYPTGIVGLPNGNVAVSEAWRSQVVEISPEGKIARVMLDEIPGYPGRIHRRPTGGFWLAIFAPRSPLIEFVLREPGYRKSMLAELAPEHWIAPSFISGQSFHEPLQGGALKQMGILKPWAPTRSYGLVVATDADFIPQRSFHSRSGGKRHGITSAVEHEGTLWLTSRGCSEVLAMPLKAQGENA